MQARSSLLGVRLALLGVLLALGAAGCATPIPAGRRSIDALEFDGVHAVDGDELSGKLATGPSPRFLGLIPGVFEYELYDKDVLQRDIDRVIRFYRSRGYYEARVAAARVIPAGGRAVRVELRIVEKDPVRLARITFRPKEEPGVATAPLAPELLDALRARLTLTTREARLPDGRLDPSRQPIFDEDTFNADKEALLSELLDRGYAQAAVDAKATIDLPNHSARVVYELRLGPVAYFDEPRIPDLQGVPRRQIGFALAFKKGDRFSQRALTETRDALAELGVFGAVDVSHEVNKANPELAQVHIRLTEAKRRTLRLGAGAQLDQLRFATGLRGTWADRNFLGNLRALTVDLRPSVTWFPLRFSELTSPQVHRFLPENRLRTELVQPNLFARRQTGQLGLEYNVYPFLFPLAPGSKPENEVIIGYHEVKTRVGLEQQLAGGKVIFSPALNWQANSPFTYQGERPASLGLITVFAPSVDVAVDLRDDRLSPTRGVWLGNALEVALPGLGAVTDLRLKPEGRVYIPLDRRPKPQFVLALRGALGFLVPLDYGGSLRGETGSAESDATIRDQQKLLFRVFYAGGPGSNRGYPFRGVGPHGVVGFLVPNTATCVREPDGTVGVATECNRPLGGLSLWETSAELRFPIFGALRGTFFVDASDVQRGIASFRVDTPHLSPGFGARYQTPVGPVRIDIAYPLIPTLVRDDPATPDIDESARSLQNEPLRRVEDFSDVLAQLSFVLALGEAF